MRTAVRLRFVPLLLAFAGTASSQAADPVTRLKAGLGGSDALNAVARFDYRLTVHAADGRVLRDGDYVLLPASRALYVGERDSGARVWSGEGNDTWRLLADAQWEFLGADAAEPYRGHVAYHFVPLLLDARTGYEAKAPDRIRITPVGNPAFEVRIDPRSGRILENHFDSGVFGRETDYRHVGALHWPMGFELVERGRTTRLGRFTDVRVGGPVQLPTMPTEGAAARALPEARNGVARLAGAGWISADGNEYNLSLDADERMMVFARSQAEFEHARILFARRDGGAWSEPQPVPFTDTRYSDSDPWLTPDGRTMYFVSNRPRTGDAARKDLDLWRVSVHDGSFGRPEPLSALSSDAQELGPELHAGWLYFNSTRKGGPAAMSIYRARVAGAGFEPPQPLGAPFNDGSVQGDFTLSPDGRLAMFWSVRDGSAEADLFAVRREGEGWSKAIRLPSPLNAGGLDFTPSFSADGRTLRFASMRQPAWPAGHRMFNGQSNVYVMPVAAVDAAFAPPR